MLTATGGTHNRVPFNFKRQQMVKVKIRIFYERR